MTLRRWTSHLGFRLLLVGAFSLAAHAADSDALRQRQQAQEKARALASELVSAVLDVQLRQLEENGLKSLPIYRDIVSMKANIDGLVHTDMDAVIQLLTAAQEGDPQDRLAKLNTARAKIRDVVVQLMAERQKLYRRMHVARLAAEGKQLIALQTKTHDATNSLPERRPDERERLALATIEDQADVNKLYYQLVVSLADVATWGGPAAAGASDSLRILKAAQVEPELKSAAAALGKADFPAAAASQRAVLKGLFALLEKLEETQGLTDGDREAALRLARELIAKQQALRDQTRKSELTERTAEPLIDQQTRLQKDLSKLAAALTRFPTTESFIEQAKAASFEATAKLFEEKKPPALDEQGRVIGNLAQIEKVLAEGLDLGLSDKSADELAAEIASLQELQKHLETASLAQSQAVDATAAQPQAAAQHELHVADLLKQTTQLGDFANIVNSKLDDAKQLVSEAQQAMQNPAPQSSAARHDAAEKALAAIHQAQAEVQSQLADTIRRQKAVEVGELARAAEALERASAAEREIARLTGEAAKSDEWNATKLAALAIEQADVGEVAARIVLGVKNTSPETSQMLEQAIPAIIEIGQQLDRLPQSTAADKPIAATISTSAVAAAQHLADAAAQLRKQQGLSAEALEKIAGQQLAAAETARQAVEKATETAKSSPVEAIFLLEQARKKVNEAQGEQAKAEGRALEAQSNQIAEQIAALVKQQDHADQAAHELARGIANTPLEAASEQQAVADNASDLAPQSPAEVAQPLIRAARAAAEAARETLGGSPPKAEAARKQAKTALVQALQLAQQTAKQAAQSPPGKPDAAAQKSVADKAGQAQEFANEAATSAGQPARAAVDALSRARQVAKTASQQIESAQLAEASAAQATLRKLLADAKDNLDAALRDLAARDSTQLAEQAHRAPQLAKQAAQIDSGAAAALAQIPNAAARAAQADSGPSQTAHARQEVQHKLDQALANLAACEQQLRHHRDLAQTLATLATDQKSAREAIAQAAKQLEQQPPDADRLAQQLAAAQALQQAEQQFADTQTATGEGAAEVSGQQEVANQPIREALEIASRLNQPAPPLSSPTEGQPSGEADPASKGTKDAQQTTEAQPNPNQKSNSQNPKSPAQLGTKMVPSSPQITAKQIAGPQAKNAAASAMAAAMKGKAKGEPGQGQGETDTPKEGESSSTAKKGGAAKGGQTANNQKAKQGDLETADAADADSRGELANQDASAAGRRLESEAWFARLPPSLRSAIQAKTRGNAPRGYEERLRRYFESVD